MVDLTPYLKNIPPDIKRSLSNVNPRSEFAKELRAKGFKFDEPIIVDKLVRIADPEDKAGEDTGWYVYHECDDEYRDGRVFGVGVYGSWRGVPVERATWTSKSVYHMSKSEKVSFSEKIRKANDLRERRRQEKYNEAALKARDLLSVSKDMDKEIKHHSYLKTKQVQAYDGVKVSVVGDLIIPVLINGKISSVQFIKPTGKKRFLSGGKVKGGYFKIDGIGDTVYVCEGYATGATVHEATEGAVYVAFNAGNLYEVAAFAKKDNPHKHVVIAADDDRYSSINVGIKKAKQAARGLNITYIVPKFKLAKNQPTDFNDLMVNEGLDAVKKIFVSRQKKWKAKSLVHNEDEALSPTGVLSEIVDYYNATSGHKQPLFAVQTALALCSLVLGRRFETNFSNRTSLYLLNVGKSGTGKEHAKKIIEKILNKSGDGRLIMSNGYTSGGAVISALLQYPRHMTIIDEFSKYMKAAGNPYGSSHLMEANSYLMQCISSLDGVIRPKAYSTMTLSKKDSKKINEKLVVNPAITLIGMSTPDELFKVLGMQSIRDGFLNRFIIAVSDKKRTMREHKEPLDVPNSILDWMEAIKERYDYETECHSDAPNLITLEFTDAAMRIEQKFQQYCIEKANELDNMGLNEVCGRSNEMSMRIALIAALSEDPLAKKVDGRHLIWATEYVKMNMEYLVKKLQMKVAGSQFEANKKEILEAIREREGVTWTEMQKRTPFSKFRKSELEEILEALEEGGLIDAEPFNNGKRGRPTKLWFAIE